MRRWTLIGVFAIVALGFAGVYWRIWGGDPAPAPPALGRGQGMGGPVPVATATVAAKDVPVYVDALGTVQAYNSVLVRSRADGQLIEVPFKEGQDVRAGDVLARIDPRIYQAQYEQAQATRDKDAAQLQAARHDLERYIGLGNRVTGQSVDTQRALVRQLEAAVRADQAAVDLARTTLDYTVITAPIDGRVGLRMVDKGNIIRAGDQTGLVLLTQVQPISVVFTVPQQTLPAIGRAMAAQGPLEVRASQTGTGAGTETGHLETVDNQIDSTTGTVRLKAVMPNQQRLLWPGGFVNVRLLLSIHRDGLVIPVAAVQRGPKGAYAFVVRDDRTVEMRPVETALVENDEALIESGLQAGETVVTEGMGRLKDGGRVTLADGRGDGGEGRKRSGTAIGHPAVSQ